MKLEIEMSLHNLVIEIITPKKAKALLLGGDNIRKLNNDVVTKYANDMTHGHWQPVPVAICFDRGGSLVNGQHRLAAIVESNTAQEMLIARNVSNATIAAMDDGLKRSMAVKTQLLGVEMNGRTIACARFSGFGPYASASSAATLIDIYEKHKKSIDFGVSCAPSYPAPVMAAFARAHFFYLSQGRNDVIEDLITEMAPILSGHKHGGDGESSALLVWKNKGVSSVSSSTDRYDLYLRTEYAITKFIERKPVRSLLKLKQETFPPLP